MKVMQKYFLALLPPPEILTRVTDIKLRLREEFGLKYALKSPPHITLKMPFSYNEANERLLVERLEGFMEGREPFTVRIAGADSFGNRVVFLGVEKSQPLLQLQHDLKVFCKRELHLVDELSDRNFHPHMTVAFRDLKPRQFTEVRGLVTEIAFHAEYSVGEICVLKRVDGTWIPRRMVNFRG